MAYQQEGDLVIETIDLAALQALCGRKLARYKRPATIVVVDTIPKASTIPKWSYPGGGTITRAPASGGISSTLMPWRTRCTHRAAI
jgi:hypothetical protein